MEPEQILQKAHRICKTYKHGDDEPYRFDEGCMLQFANALLSTNDDIATIAYLYAKAECRPSIERQHEKIKRLQEQLNGEQV